MIEYCDVINKVKKDKFLVRFYEKHKDAIIFKKRYDELMDTYRAIFRLSGDLILIKDKEIKRSNFNLYSNPYSRVTSCFLPPIKDSLSKRYNIPKKEKPLLEVWTLVGKDGWKMAEFAFKDRCITFKLYPAFFNTDIMEDNIMKKYITEETAFLSIKLYNLENLEEVLNRLVELEG